MELQRELDIFLRARFTLIFLVTHEEERALEILKGVCEKRKRPLITWDIGDGFRCLHGDAGNLQPVTDPLLALQNIEQADGEAVYVLLDFHDCWNYPNAKRKLRTLARTLKFTKKSIIILSYTDSTPQELKNDCVTVEMPLPDSGDLDRVLEGLMKTPGVKINLNPDERNRMVDAAVGLTVSQAQRIFAKAIVSDGVLDARDIDLVTKEKKDIIRGSEALEFYTPKEGSADIGGLEVLKEWLELREKSFSKEAKDYGIPAPKGIALIGIPGTGKSLTAKMIGSMWHMPVVRFDVGALFRPYIGQSEETARKALRLAEAVAPCVLWIDEMEKALSVGDHDGGTSKRVFGSILTWMQEKTAPCFVVATANNVSSLPPELLRRGRFDEIFFLDLPTAVERDAIFRVHLKKKRRDPERFDVKKLVDQTQGFVGAEIEQLILDSMFHAFNEKRELNTEDLLAAAKRLVPLSVSQREVIKGLQSWVDEGRATPASRHAEDGSDREKLSRDIGFN